MSTDHLKTRMGPDFSYREEFDCQKTERPEKRILKTFCCGSNLFRKSRRNVWTPGAQRFLEPDGAGAASGAVCGWFPGGRRRCCWCSA